MDDDLTTPNDDEGRPPFSESGSVNAPFIFVDGVSAHGFLDPLVILALEAVRVVGTRPGEPVSLDRIIVAHVRMTVQAAVILRNALNDVILLAQPSKSKAKN